MYTHKQNHLEPPKVLCSTLIVALNTYSHSFDIIFTSSSSITFGYSLLKEALSGSSGTWALNKYLSLKTHTSTVSLLTN